jgi:mono/diheme cytochrome c family protein
MMLAAAFAALLADAATAALPGVSNEARARMNWMLHCQGCHQAEAKGSPSARTPAMAGEVSRFLGVEGGREYLTRVPGVANAGLPDDQLAELLNWTLATFDAEHLPEIFEPFSSADVAAGRKAPLVSEAARVREEIMKRFVNAARAGGGE